MNQRSGFALWSGLLVTGPWSTVVLASLAGTVAVYFAAAAFHVPLAARLSNVIGYYAGKGCTVVALLTVVLGVPILARRYRVGFWRGLLTVVAAIAWLALPLWLLFVLLGPGSAVLVAAGLNFLVAAACVVILYRRRRAKRREPPNVADVFT